MDFEPKPKDYKEEIEVTQRVARIFGYNGLTIDVRPGAGWQTIKTDSDITLVVDPTMLQPQTLKDASGAELPTGIQAPKQYSIYGIAHELGHVDDFMQPESNLEELENMKPSEHFFWNVLDDGVINRRLRNIPLLNSITDEVYKDMLFPVDDYTQSPKHVQLMYGWLLRNVTPGREVVFSDDVTAALDSLSAVNVAGKKYDLYRTLSHPNTNYGMRHEIAKTHMLPIYETFMQIDQDNQQQQQDSQNSQDQNQQSQSSNESSGSGGEQPQEQNGSSKDQPGDGQQIAGDQSGDWDNIYDSYSEATHCGHQEHQQDKDSNNGADNATKQDPHDAIKQVAEAIKEAKEEQDQAKKDAAMQQPSNSQGGDIAGSIAAELELSPEDALEYQKVVVQYRTQIHEVSKVLQQLTVPSIEYTSPRYKRRADVSGLKLSPRDLFQVVVAHHTDIDPAIWRPVETVSKKEGLSFNGLDIHLIIDSSGSMNGQKANSAAACGVMLMEGLALARRTVQRYNPRAPKPDVRLQVVLFGSSAKVVAPLGHETSAKDKGIAFTTTKNAGSGSTIVADALTLTVDSGKANPGRTQLVYLITDGDFSDRPAATRVLNNATSNYFLYQYILLSPGTTPITTQSSHINDPTQLPGNMNKQLKALANKLLVN